MFVFESVNFAVDVPAAIRLRHQVAVVKTISSRFDQTRPDNYILLSSKIQQSSARGPIGDRFGKLRDFIAAHPDYMPVPGYAHLRKDQQLYIFFLGPIDEFVYARKVISLVARPMVELDRSSQNFH